MPTALHKCVISVSVAGRRYATARQVKLNGKISRVSSAILKRILKEAKCSRPKGSAKHSRRNRSPGRPTIVSTSEHEVGDIRRIVPPFEGRGTTGRCNL